MKAISLWQPWASAVALGLKQFETRSWRTNHRGPIAIHAAKVRDHAACMTFDYFMEVLPEFNQVFTKAGFTRFKNLPIGCVIATAHLSEIITTEDFLASPGNTELERTLGNYRPKRFAWFLFDVRQTKKPIPIRGYQRLFDVQGV